MPGDDFANATQRGDALYRQGDAAGAADAYREAVALRPDEPFAHNSLGAAAQRAGDLEAALAAFNEAIRLKPDFAAAHSNLGNLLLQLGRPEESIASCERAIALHPDFAGALNNLGNALLELRRQREAIEYFDRALALAPPFAPGVHVNKSHALLLLGELEAGFAEYEHRPQRAPVTPPRQSFLPPRWNGEPLDGRTLLITSEQGYGDVIQFVRYAPLAAERGARVIVACVPELRALLTSARGVSLAPAPQDAPRIDVQIPILSLPHLFPRTLETLPRDVPYLSANSERIDAWKARIGADHGFRVGLAWSSHPTGHDAAKKSCPIEHFAPLTRMEGVTDFSLQIGATAPTPMVDLTREIKDFADTAALMHHLDLVITIDTAVAHLAGALGKEVWTILPFAADCRWLIDRTDSPWYPTMKLFRQPRAGDWPSVIDSVARALERRLRL